ncbi:MAG: hypothetical protein WD889_01365 [Candidatus Colwellbacteria bacterium]
MATIEKFEDLICWQKARLLTQAIYKEFKDLKFKVEECSKLTSNFIKSLKSSEFMGLQYKKEKTKAQKEREEFSAYLKEIVERGRKEKV